MPKTTRKYPTPDPVFPPGWDKIDAADPWRGDDAADHERRYRREGAHAFPATTSPRLAVAAALPPALAARALPRGARMRVVGHLDPRVTRRDGVVAPHGTAVEVRHRHAGVVRMLVLVVPDRPGTAVTKIASRLARVARALARDLAKARALAESRGFAVIAAAPGTVRWRADRPSVADPALAGVEFRAIPGWPYDIDRSGRVRSYHASTEDRAAGVRIAAVPVRFLALRSGTVTLFAGEWGSREHRRQSFRIAELIKLAWGGGAVVPSPPLTKRACNCRCHCGDTLDDLSAIGG